MKIESKETHTLITPSETSVKEFHTVFETALDNFKGNHLILDFSEIFNTTIKEILLLLNIAIEKRENGTSFVIIIKGIDIDEIPDEINVVPTMIEALDVLEMDAIERDLMGF